MKGPVQAGPRQCMGESAKALWPGVQLPRRDAIQWSLYVRPLTQELSSVGTVELDGCACNLLGALQVKV